MSVTAREIASQPAVWRQAISLRERAVDLLGRPGEKILIIGCGTSAFVAESVAALREAAGFGVTDAAYASEPFPWRDYDTVIALTRSGTTSEILDAIRALPAGVATVAITGVEDSPVTTLVDETLLLDFADEASVVQTRFPTTVILLARAAFGQDPEPIIAEAEEAVVEPLEIDASLYDHFVYLGSGWTHGLAQEAALKIREAAQAWSESYPLLDYRHGPISVAGERSIVWMLGKSDESLAEQIRAVGAAVVVGSRDPLVELIQAQRLAIAVAELRGLNPDAPRHLSRSIVLG